MYMDQSNHPVSNPLPIRTMQKSSELNSHSSNGRGGAHPNTSGGHSRSSADQYQFRSNDDNDNCKHQLFVLYIYNYIILLLLLFLFFDYDYSDDKEIQSTVHTINYYLPRPTCCSMHHSSFHSIHPPDHRHHHHRLNWQGRERERKSVTQRRAYLYVSMSQFVKSMAEEEEEVEVGMERKNTKTVLEGAAAFCSFLTCRWFFGILISFSIFRSCSRSRFDFLLFLSID